MFCAHCGAKNNDDSGFCESCGVRLAGAVAPPPATSAAPQQPAEAQAPPPSPTPPPVYSAPPAAPPPPPPAYSAPAYGGPPQPPYPGYPPPTGSPAAPKRNLGLLLGVGAVVVIAAAAGYWFFVRGSGGGNKFDPVKASDYAHGAMISTADFPGSGWGITSVDDFSTDDPANDPAFAGPSCSAVKAQMVIFRNSMNASQSGKAKTEYSQDSSDVSATINVSIQKDTKNTSSDLSKYQQTMQHGEMAKCLESVMTTSGADTARATKGTPLTSAPKGGVATAYDLNFSVQGQSLTMRIEDYAWSYSNAMVNVSVSGSKDKLTSDIVNAAVSKTQAQLEKISSGTFATPVLPTTGPAKSPTTAAKSPTTASKSPTTVAKSTATGPTPNAAVTTWGKNLCTAVGPFNSATDPIDAADSYPSSMTLDQMKTQFQKDEKTYSDTLAKTITAVQAVQAPSSAAKVQDAFLTAMRQIKAAYDIAAVQASLAKTAADFDTALTTASTVYETAGGNFITALDSAPADVQEAVSACD